MVVDDVKQDGQAFRMAGIYQPLQPLGPPYAWCGAYEGDPFVAPAIATEELRNRHDLDVSNAELHQMVESLDGGREGSFRGEGSDVKL